MNQGNEAKKVIGLLAAVVIIFGIFALRVVNATAPKPAAGPTTVSLTPDPGAGTSAPPDAKAVVDISPPANATAVDPFRPIASPAGSKPTDGQGAKPPTPSGTKPVVLPPMKGSVKPIGIDPSKLAATLPVKLTGIMTGRPPIGVFQVGANEEIRKVGEALSDGFVVKAIRGQTAILVKQKVRIVLTMSSPTQPNK